MKEEDYARGNFLFEYIIQKFKSEMDFIDARGQNRVAY